MTAPSTPKTRPWLWLALEILLYLGLLIGLPALYGSTLSGGESKSTIKFIYQDF